MGKSPGKSSSNKIINPVRDKSDQHQFSPNNINT